jgi:methionyl-tRNA formyltransferase
VAQEGQKLRIVFLGTPDFAATILRRLAKWPGGDVAGVLTQPDRPCGRGQVCTPPPVKTLALELGIPVHQPENLKADENVELLEALSPDLLVVAAYGLILPQRVLDLAPRGAVNVHASLLPRYRGAAPIQRSIMRGDPVTGVTIMRMVKAMDAGPILLQRALPIRSSDTAQTIHDELAELGAELLVEALDMLRDGTLVPMEQDHKLATYAPKLEKGEGLIDWDRPAREVHNQIRGLYPWPGSYYDWLREDGASLRLTVFPGRIGRELDGPVAPGSILGVEDDNIAIACRDKVYLTPVIKASGGKALDARSFSCGYLNRCRDQ